MQFAEVARQFGQKPFQPLMVRMVSGTRYRVNTPETIVSHRFAAFLLPDGTIATVALEIIEEIRPLAAAARKNGNGRRKH